MNQYYEHNLFVALTRRTGRVQITLCRLEHKVDLEASAIIRRLREMQEL